MHLKRIARHTNTICSPFVLYYCNSNSKNISISKFNAFPGGFIWPLRFLFYRHTTQFMVNLSVRTSKGCPFCSYNKYVIAWFKNFTRNFPSKTHRLSVDKYIYIYISFEIVAIGELPLDINNCCGP